MRTSIARTKSNSPRSKSLCHEDRALEELPGTASIAFDPIASTQSIDLTTALLLTSGENPQVGFAQARIEESLAQLERAEVLWLPSIRGGV